MGCVAELENWEEGEVNHHQQIEINRPRDKINSPEQKNWTRPATRNSSSRESPSNPGNDLENQQCLTTRYNPTNQTNDHSEYTQVSSKLH